MSKKLRGRPFLPGNAFGRGRPKGSRNREKVPGQRLLEEWAEHLTGKAISMAMQGDIKAMGYCWDRIHPVLRSAGASQDRAANQGHSDIVQILKAGRARAAAAARADELERQSKEGGADSNGKRGSDVGEG